MDLSNLLTVLCEQGQFQAFRTAFDWGATSQAGQNAAYRRIGRRALEALLDRHPHPDTDLLRWFAERIDQGVIEPSASAHDQLSRLESQLRLHAESRQRRKPPDRSVLSVKRVVQLSWFGTAGFQASDQYSVKTCVFRSPQERTFYRALRERFPGLLALPNYPLDQIASLDMLRTHIDPNSRPYAASWRLDAVLVTPIEGDPVACFELDSRLHDSEQQAARDAMRNQLLAAAALPLFRLRSQDPTSTTVDEWYQLLTEEVLPKLDTGDRIRNRDTHATLVPLT
ncbi:hypothetical protein IP84_02395 [beta proteobacterium AAP99]|nr:hypothetical protein IP84_02395 [beta proteobacterium AAP99]